MTIRPRLPRYALSGGPKSGKSTILELLREMYPRAIHFVPEMATLLHEQAGIRVAAPGTPEHRAYSHRITMMQIHLEDAADDQARADGKLLVYCDRGIVDNVAYLPGLQEEFERVTGVRVADAHGRYDGAHVLELAPRHVFEDPSRGFNPSRRETYEEAVALDRRTYDVWMPHPGCRRFGNELGWDGKVRGVMSDVERILRELGMEAA